MLLKTCVSPYCEHHHPVLASDVNCASACKCIVCTKSKPGVQRRTRGASYYIMKRVFSKMRTHLSVGKYVSPKHRILLQQEIRKLKCTSFVLNDELKF